MKKRLLYMLVVLGGIFSGSCESYLEEVPQNKLKPNTTDDYDQLLNYGYLTEQVVPYLDILSDDVDLIASDHSMEGDDYGDVYVAAYMWNKDNYARGGYRFREILPKCLLCQCGIGKYRSGCRDGTE